MHTRMSLTLLSAVLAMTVSSVIAAPTPADSSSQLEVCYFATDY
jgi:hypothetical protein